MIKVIMHLALLIFLTALSSNCFAYTDPNKSYSIQLPKGWHVSQKTTKSSDNCIQAIHPSGAGVVSVQSFKDDELKEKLRIGTPIDFSNKVNLAILRKTCPSAQLIDAGRLTLNGIDGVECLLVCGPYYYDELTLLHNDDVYQIIGTYVNNEQIGDIVRESISTFKAGKSAKKPLKARTK
jgi:hypothetical protein